MAILAILAGLGWLVISRSGTGVALGALAFLAYSRGSRALLLADHQRGMRLLQAGKYEAANEAFERSYRFLSRKPWIDRWRSVILMSPSAVSYQEMALVNIAFAYSQAGQGSEAKAAYERTLRHFPDSAIAQAALRMIEAVEQSGKTPAPDP
jgi:tetratricopeptide (TPR) repeat protein